MHGAPYLKLTSYKNLENIYSTRAIVEIEVDIILKSSSGKIIFLDELGFGVPFKRINIPIRRSGDSQRKAKDGSYDIWLEDIETKAIKCCLFPLKTSLN